MVYILIVSIFFFLKKKVIFFLLLYSCIEIPVAKCDEIIISMKFCGSRTSDSDVGFPTAANVGVLLNGGHCPLTTT